MKTVPTNSWHLWFPRQSTEIIIKREETMGNIYIGYNKKNPLFGLRRYGKTYVLCVIKFLICLDFS